jgi:hypothetical protein
MNFKQLRIRAYLRGGVISDQYLPLDGILYNQAVRKQFGSQVVAVPGSSMVKEGANINLPIIHAGPKGDAWFYACSFAQWPENTIEDSSFKVKSGDWLRDGHYLAPGKKINTGSGKYKNYHIKLYYRHALYVEWYCIGDPQELVNLLNFCTHIGKNGGDGWGEVLRWEVQEWPEDWSIRGPGNKLMRAVPAKDSGFLYGIRPSYWLQKHIFPCKMPE